MFRDLVSFANEELSPFIENKKKNAKNLSLFKDVNVIHTRKRSEISLIRS